MGYRCRHGKRDEPAGRQVPVHVRRGRRGNAQRGQPTRSNARMDTQRGEPKPDIIEPSAPPETPVPPQPRETPLPNAPELIPSPPEFVPGVRQGENPASHPLYLSEKQTRTPTPTRGTKAKPTEN